MKVLVVTNQKGGVGKTSILVHLAFDFFERGKKVAVIDLDTQGNASYTLQKYKSGITAKSFFNGEPFIADANNSNFILFESDDRLANIEVRLPSLDVSHNYFRMGLHCLLNQKVDICLIDTAPSLGLSMATALLSADYVISPIELETYSIQGIKRMNAVISNIRKTNSRLVFLGMVLSKVDKRNPRHLRHLKQLQSSYPQLVIPAYIGLRSSFADAMASGVPVWQIKRSAARVAAKEIRALADYVFTKMETE